MERGRGILTIVGDVGVDFVMGPLAGWPRVGTETIVERNELRAGGSGANTALAVRHIGGRSHLVSGVGDDDWGRWLVGQLDGLGASLGVLDSPTTVSVGLIDASGERSFLTTRGHLERLDVEHVLGRVGPAPHPGALVLLSGVFLAPRLRVAYPRLMRELERLGYRIALDTNWPPEGWSEALRAEVAAWLPLCDHLLLNDLEARSLAGAEDLEAAIEQLAARLRPPATLVVKTGASGAIGVEAGGRSVCPALKTRAFDTIGAGDSFNAGYLVARLGGAGLADALRAGCRAAGEILARFPRRLSGGAARAQMTP